MFSRKKTVEIIDKFIELTQHNKINWVSEEPITSMVGPDIRVDLVYLAEHIGRKISVYKEHFKYYLDEEKYTWDEQIIVEFIDSDRNSLGILPKTPNANELLKAIQFQNPQINSFYDELFQ